MSQSKNATQTHTQFGCFLFNWPIVRTWLYEQLVFCVELESQMRDFPSLSFTPSTQLRAYCIQTKLAGWLVRYRKSHFRNWPPQVFYFSTLPSWIRCMWFTSFFVLLFFLCWFRFSELFLSFHFVFEVCLELKRT